LCREPGAADKLLMASVASKPSWVEFAILCLIPVAALAVVVILTRRARAGRVRRLIFTVNGVSARCALRKQASLRDAAEAARESLIDEKFTGFQQYDKFKLFLEERMAYGILSSILIKPARRGVTFVDRSGGRLKIDHEAGRHVVSDSRNVEILTVVEDRASR
jgi:hypothetical protein